MKFNKNVLIIASSWILLASALFFLHFSPKAANIPLKKSFLYFPFQIGEWTDKEKPRSDYLVTVLGADDILIREYKNAQGDALELYFSYFNYTKDKKTPHAPQLCWVGAGWELKNLGDQRLSIPCDKCPSVNIKKVLAQKDGQTVLMFYCYKINEKYVADLFTFRAMSAFGSIIRGRNNAFTLQLSSPVNPRDFAQVESRMKDFLVKAFSILETDYLP